MKAIITPTKNACGVIFYLIGIADNENAWRIERHLLRAALSASTALLWQEKLQEDIDHARILFSKKERAMLAEQKADIQFCPHCKSNLYRSDKNLEVKCDVLVDVYECEWENKQFVVKAGTYIIHDSIHRGYDLRTGEETAEAEN